MTSHNYNGSHGSVYSVLSSVLSPLLALSWGCHPYSKLPYPKEESEVTSHCGSDRTKVETPSSFPWFFTASGNTCRCLFPASFPNNHEVLQSYQNSWPLAPVPDPETWVCAAHSDACFLQNYPKFDSIMLFGDQNWTLWCTGAFEQ